MLNLVHTQGTENLARVFVLKLSDGSQIECVESVQPPIPRDKKWVLIVSTLKGCPVSCPICDAGGSYQGKLTPEEIFAQIEFMLLQRFPEGCTEIPKLKIQFARMGDPAFNDAVLTVLKELPSRFDIPGLVPCISTVAPRGKDPFFESVLEIKNKLYSKGRFQMQFSLHTTCEEARATLIPTNTWSFKQIAQYGNRFFKSGDYKVALNFAAVKGLPLDPEHLTGVFSQERFAIKLTPINPTRAAQRSGLTGLIDPADEESCRAIVQQFEKVGYQTILSIGELEENKIGSNCGMYVQQSNISKRDEFGRDRV